MKRRDFIALVGGTIALPTGAAAQQRSAEPPRVGVLKGSRSEAFDAFTEGLRKAGYIDGQNLLMEARFYGTSLRAANEFASELVALKSTVIFASDPYAIRAVRPIQSQLLALTWKTIL